MSSAAMLWIESLFFRYSTSKDYVLKEINAQVNAGEIVGLLGPNGAGKTTLIKLITGLYAPNEGAVKINNHNPNVDVAIRHKMGIMHQSSGFDQMLTGWENLFIAGKFYGISKSEVEDRVRDLQVCDTFDFFSRPVITFSGGEKRRLQIVRALLHDPSLVLLDEPTVGLDVSGRRQFYKTLGNIIERKGLTVVWTSHYLEEIEQNCDRVIILNAGNIAADASVKSLRERTLDEEILITCDSDLNSDITRMALEKFNLTESSPGEIIYRGDVKHFYQSVLPELNSIGLKFQNISSKAPSLEDIYLDIVAHIETYKRGTQ